MPVETVGYRSLIRAMVDVHDYDREKLQERLAKLVGGVAVIKFGAAEEQKFSVAIIRERERASRA